MPRHARRLRAALVLAALASLAAADTGPLPAGPLEPLASWDFDAGRGDTLYDRSGNGHHGLIHGAAWVEGLKGRALAFDGNDWVEVPGDPGLQVRSFTLSLWLWQSGNGFSVPLAEFQAPGEPVGVHLWANTDGWARDLPGSFYANLRPLDASAAQPGEVRERNLLATPPGTADGCRWNHVVLSLDHRALQARIYVNGRLRTQRALQAFTPRTVGSLLLGIRSPASPEWQAGSGLVGRLDQVDLYGRALAEDEVRALYGRKPAEPLGVHLGIKTHSAAAGDNVRIPVYLSGDGRSSLTSLRFDLELDTAVAELLDAEVDALLAPGWRLQWQAGVPARLYLSGSVSLGAREGALLHLRARVRPGARRGASTLIHIQRLSAGEGEEVELSATPGRLIVMPRDRSRGDVDGDGDLDSVDVRIILDQVVARRPLPLPDCPAYTEAIADVTGKGEVSSLDAAQVLQVGLALLEEFPEGMPPAHKRAAAAYLSVAAPEPLSGNRFRYRIEGTGLAGLVAGELRLRVSASIAAISDVRSGLFGARLVWRFDPEGGTLSLAAALSRKAGEGRIAFLEVDAEHREGVAGAGVWLESAWLNEGGIAVEGLDSRPIASGTGTPGAPGLRMRGAAEGEGQRPSAPGQRLRGEEVFDLRGRRLFPARNDGR